MILFYGERIAYIRPMLTKPSQETGKGPDADEKGETAIEFNFSNARRSL